MGIYHNFTILCICYSISVIDNQLCYILYPSIGCLSLAVVTVVTLGFQHYNGCMLVHVHALLGFFHTSRNRIGIHTHGNHWPLTLSHVGTM